MSITKDDVCKEFCERYSLLRECDRDDFSRVCNKLLNCNFIYGQLKEDKNDYHTIVRLQEEIIRYFLLIGYTLNQDNTYKIFFLKSDSGSSRVKLKLMESVLILLFRKFYYVKGKDVGATVNIPVSFDELIDEINKTHIFKDKFGKGQLQDSLKLLRRYKLINFDSINNESNSFEIYPTILHVVTDMDMKMIEDKLNSYKNSDEGNTTDEANED